MNEVAPVFTRTKIVGTIGPASESVEMISSLLEAGLDVARINFSHGNREQHRSLFKRLREVSEEKGKHLAILCDIQGPKIRTGKMKEPFWVNQGDMIRITSEEVLGTPERFSIDHPGIVEELDPDDEIFINDGTIKMRVRKKEGNDLICEVRNGGLISDRKGCNIPSSNIFVDIPTEKDLADLEVIADLDPEYIAASFIGSSEDVKKIREVLRSHDKDDIKIISKIERPKALENLEEIMEVSDGIMVARGDLGVEIPPYEVPAAQKEMCRLANQAGIPVIVATQMLNSMIEHSRPTRAEAADVFNAVLDGADALMLSNETAVGKDPVLVVNTMKDIIRRAEDHFPYRDPDYYDSDDQCMIETIGHAAYTLIKEFDDREYSGSIIAVTDSGQSARMISKYRPNRTILAVTPNIKTANELAGVWGVVPIHSVEVSTDLLEMRMIDAVKTAVDRGYLSRNDHVVVVSSSMVVGDMGMVACVYKVSSLFES